MVYTGTKFFWAGATSSLRSVYVNICWQTNKCVFNVEICLYATSDVLCEL